MHFPYADTHNPILITLPLINQPSKKQKLESPQFIIVKFEFENLKMRDIINTASKDGDHLIDEICPKLARIAELKKLLGKEQELDTKEGEAACTDDDSDFKELETLKTLNKTIDSMIGLRLQAITSMQANLKRK